MIHDCLEIDDRAMMILDHNLQTDQHSNKMQMRLKLTINPKTVNFNIFLINKHEVFFCGQKLNTVWEY